MGMFRGGFIGGMLFYPGTEILMNISPLKIILEEQPHDIVWAYTYHILLHEYIHSLGILDEKQLRLFKPYIQGVCGTVECITPKLRDKLCPSKPLKEIEDMFKIANKLGLKKTITIIMPQGVKHCFYCASMVFKIF